ncbi:putative membrane protein [[Clostridium] cellulosi]|uniref:Putative membrane protein n=1 Tax=[Clostridium] cellulosi TaxID=29343 RepID=A0A078KMM8_9FIRM|nr:putative membrane protein [[Clostridium] cellulosi]
MNIIKGLFSILATFSIIFMNIATTIIAIFKYKDEKRSYKRRK